MNFQVWFQHPEGLRGKTQNEFEGKHTIRCFETCLRSFVGIDSDGIDMNR